MSAGAGNEAAVTARTGCAWDKHRECGESLNGKRFPPKHKRSFYKSHMKSAIQYGNESWCCIEI